MLAKTPHPTSDVDARGGFLVIKQTFYLHKCNQIEVGVAETWGNQTVGR